MNKAYYILSDRYNPYHNIALEEFLLRGLPDDAFVLYLWQNERTVVIGKNQNAFAECHVETLAGDGGHLARRLSGGGAVYHDLGNVNFTFLYNKKAEDIVKQSSVIAEAVRSFGLEAQMTGRNDITIDGRKFSGNAYLTQGNRAYHHGTIMLDVKQDDLIRYLNVDPEKFRSKGVDSVRSRVVNLKELNSSITPDSIKTAMLSAFEKVYGVALEPLPEAWINQDKIAERTAFFGSRDWLHGRSVAVTWVQQKRFPWGNIRLELEVTKGRIADAAVYTDALDANLFHDVPKALIGTAFEKQAVCMALQALPDTQSYHDLGTLLLDAFC